MSNPRGCYEKEPGTWYVRYADSSGRLRREKAGTKSAAQMLYRKRKTEALQGKKLPETLRRKSKTIGDLLDAANTKVLARSKQVRLGADKQDYRFGTLKKLLGNLNVETSGKEISGLLESTATERKWGTASFNRHRAFVILAFNLAGLPVPKPKIPRLEEAKRDRFLSDDEETKLREAIRARCPDRLAEFDLAINTGIRLSNQYALEWKDVNESGFIRLVHTKNGRPYSVPLNQAASNALVALRMRDPQATHVCGDSDRKAAPSQKWFLRVRRAAGLGDDVSWHTLRHTFASRLAIAGVDLRRIQELMGHESITMTARYSHLNTEHLRAAVDAISRTDTITRTSRVDSEQSAQEVSSEIFIN